MNAIVRLTGLVLAAFPIAGGAAIGLIVGIYALVFGIMYLMFAFRLRKVKTAVQAAV